LAVLGCGVVPWLVILRQPKPKATMPTLKLTREQQAALKKLRVRVFEQDLRTMTAKQLRAEFRAVSSGRMMARTLVRNAVYQAASWGIEGKAPKISGNLRSLYYQWVKPIVAKLPELLKTKTDFYELTSEALELFVGELRLFTYRDLDLVDERWENRFFTDGRNPHLLLFAEKNGFVQFLQEASKTYGLTAVALGGSPSHLSSEYLATQLKEKLKTVEPLILIGITDYDPAGADIARAFAQQLSRQGLKVAEHHQLITPRAFVDQELATLRFAVPRKSPALVSRWLKATGGIEGKAFGLEADALPKARLTDLVAQRLAPFLRKAGSNIRDKGTKT
jgi:hypothetical protein